MIEPYFIKTYHLDGMNHEIMSLPARDLLSRFDLFSKLFYVRNRKRRPHLARRVYLESLRAFVPFGKEWGKETDKSSFAKHIQEFNTLIDTFASEDFDRSVSIVPVDGNYTVIDGAHRVSILAFYDKQVTVCRFDQPVCHYGHDYFMARGMSRYAADLTMSECILRQDDISVKCVWPSDNDDIHGDILYVRAFSLKSGACRRLREAIDCEAPTIGEGTKKITVRFIFYKNTDGICDPVRTSRIANAVLSDEGRAGWYYPCSIAYWMALPFIRFADTISANRTFFKYRKQFRARKHLKDKIEQSNNKFLLSLYGVVSKLWVRDR